MAIKQHSYAIRSHDDVLWANGNNEPLAIIVAGPTRRTNMNYYDVVCEGVVLTINAMFLIECDEECH